MGGQAGWAVPPLALSPAAASAAQPPRRWGFIGGRRRGPARPLWGGGMRGGGRAAGSLRRLRTRSAPAPHPLRSAGGTAPPPSPSVPTRGHRRLLPGLGSRGARRAAGGRAEIASPGGGERLGCRGVLGRVPKRAEVKAPKEVVSIRGSCHFPRLVKYLYIYIYLFFFECGVALI